MKINNINIIKNDINIYKNDINKTIKINNKKQVEKHNDDKIIEIKKQIENKDYKIDLDKTAQIMGNFLFINNILNN